MVCPDLSDYDQMHFGLYRRSAPVRAGRFFASKEDLDMTTKTETITNISLEKFVPFQDHPFQVRDDEQMQIITESIRSVGVLVPAIARPIENVQYELIAGHRRKHACELAGLPTLPVIVRDVDRDTATVMKVDSNFQREEILPSERANRNAGT